MSTDAFLRIAALCVILACSETLHGIARIKLIVPRMGKERAIKLSAVSGTLLAFAICLVLVPSVGLETATAHLVLGLFLATFMAGFDIAIGKLLMRKPWAKIWPDFNPKTGNFLLFGLLALCFIPLAVRYTNQA